MVSILECCFSRFSGKASSLIPVLKAQLQRRFPPRAGQSLRRRGLQDSPGSAWYPETYFTPLPVGFFCSQMVPHPIPHYFRRPKPIHTTPNTGSKARESPTAPGRREELFWGSHSLGTLRAVRTHLSPPANEAAPRPISR